MPCKLIMAGIGCLLFLSCMQNKPFQVVHSDNPSFIENSVFNASENLADPKFQSLKSKYQLDTIFSGEKDELKRILLLRHWIHKKIKIDDYGPYKGNGSVESILDEALKGHGFHCGFFSSVQNAVVNAYGYITRCLLVDTGVPVDYMVGGGHHAVNEIWLNSFNKWFMSDAKYDYHFEKKGVPLSALEIRAEYLKNKGADITLVKGSERTAVAGLPEYNIKTKEQLAAVYTWISWYKYNNRYSNNPNDSADLIMYKDSYFDTHTWLWDGKPLWAYNTRYLHLIQDWQAIEWTPNTISSKVLITGSKAKIYLTSTTANWKTYQMKALPDGEWKNIPDSVEIDLRQEETKIVFRVMNLAGVTGVEHKIMIAR